MKVLVAGAVAAPMVGVVAPWSSASTGPAGAASSRPSDVAVQFVRRAAVDSTPPFALFYPALDSPDAYRLRDAAWQPADLEGSFSSASTPGATAASGPGCTGNAAGAARCVVDFRGTQPPATTPMHLVFTVALRRQAGAWRVAGLDVPDLIDGRNAEADCPLADLIAAWRGEDQDCFEPEVLSHLFYRGLPFGTKYAARFTREVVFIQLRLRDLGYRIGVDGLFGKQTAAMVRRYQQARHIQPLGFVGPATWESLFGLGPA